MVLLLKLIQVHSRKVSNAQASTYDEIDAVLTFGWRDASRVFSKMTWSTRKFGSLFSLTRTSPKLGGGRRRTHLRV